MIRRSLAGAAIGLAWIASGAAPASGVEFFADAEAGGGYDGNLNAASNGSDAEGDGFGFATGGVGIASAADGMLRSELSARWNGLLYTEYSDLSFQRLTVAGSFRARATEAITLRLTPSLGGSLYHDSDRDSFDLGVGVGARFALGPRLALDPSYTFLRRDATVSTFDRTAHRMSLALGTEPWKRGYLRVSTMVEFGQVVRYEEITGVAGGGGGGGGSGGAGGRGRPNDTFGSNWTADREDATSVEMALSLEQGLSERIFVAVGGSYARVWADPSDFDVYSTNASLGIRWP